MRIKSRNNHRYNTVIASESGANKALLNISQAKIVGKQNTIVLFFYKK